MTSSDDEREGLIAPSDGETLPSSWGDASLSLDGATSCRLLERSAPSSRSRGLFRVRHEHLSWLETLARSDVFHKLANMPLRYLLPMYAVIYIVFWILFAVWWWLAAGGDTCDAELMTFRRAYLLSLETMMTIGYGVPDPYFGDCMEVIPLLSCQSLVGLVLDAMFLNLLYSRFSSAFSRAAAVIFSDVAIAAEERGSATLAFRVCEISKRPLIEPMVRVYAVMHVPDPSHTGSILVQVRPLKLEEPDCNIADGRLFLSLPARVLHRVNGGSPLAPGQKEHGLAGVQQHWRELPFLEIIAVVSGTCPVTGTSLEARQSYTLEEIVWSSRFEPCISLVDGAHCVDFDAFHRTVPRERTR